MSFSAGAEGVGVVVFIVWKPFPQDESSKNLLLVPPTLEDELEASWRTLEGDPEYVPRRTDEELRKFVRECLANAIFLSSSVRDQKLLPMVFLPLALGAFQGWPKEELENIGVLYAYWHKAMPRSINGYPIFSELYMLHREDWAKVSLTLEREQSRLDNIDI